MYYTQKEAQEFTIPGETHGYLYPPHPKKEQSVAYIEMDGIYPEQGYSMNDVCTETLYMIEGEFEEEVDGKVYTLKAGDVLMVLPGQKYRSKGKGKAVVIITPAWDKTQNHILQ